MTQEDAAHAGGEAGFAVEGAAGELPACRFFEALAPAQRRELVGSMERHTFPPGTPILREGQQTPGLWVITAGRCEVVKQTARGEHVLAELGPGAVFGEMSFLQPAPHSATVRSVGEVIALKLDRRTYRQLEAAGSSVAAGIANSIALVLAERLRRMDEWTTRLLAPSSAEKKEEWSDFRAKLYNGWDF